ncbi:hypothetical protein LNP18_06440 [Leuconostoc citreum]|uniref:hypothetical protein n=1 Tax=Leuconostoc citreum TaxID=33964 RepID=UPI00200B7839|nr:hypothetical protein [Leuconostoc citreum]MCK8605742.1 hypothetical protein [Leuconostoc citreum]
MAWYNTHHYLCTEYLLIEQNISNNDELIVWMQMSRANQPVHLQAYQNDYLDNDFDYLFSLRQARYPLNNLVFDLDVTDFVCDPQNKSIASVRKKLCSLMNEWWETHPERHSSTSQKQRNNL